MLIEKLICPKGCEKSNFTVDENVINENTNNLSLEGGRSNRSRRINKKKSTSYTCNCCGTTFEIKENESKVIL